MVFEPHLMQAFPQFFHYCGHSEWFNHILPTQSLNMAGATLISNWCRLICHQCTKVAPSPMSVAFSSGPSTFSDLWVSGPLLLWSWSICLFPSLKHFSDSTESQNQCVLSQPSTVLNAWVEAERMRNRFFWFVEASSSCPRGVWNSSVVLMHPAPRGPGLGNLTK